MHWHYVPYVLPLSLAAAIFDCPGILHRTPPCGTWRAGASGAGVGCCRLVAGVRLEWGRG